MKKRVWRLALLLTLGLLVVSGGLAYRTFYLTLPLGQGPAGPKVSGEAFGQPWTGRKVLLLGVGDSITAGFGVPESHSILGRLTRNPDDEFAEMQGICLSRVLPDLTVRNIAVSGSTSLDHVRTIANELEVQPPDVLGLVILTSGGNDLIHDYGRSPPREGAMYGASLQQARPWIENYRQRLDAILDLIESRFPGGCHIFLADIYDPTDGVGDAPSARLPDWPDGLAIHQAYNEIIHAVAAQRTAVHLVPLHAAFLGHGVHCGQPWRKNYRSEDPTYWYGANLEDPSIRGYDAARRVFLCEIVKLAGQLK